MRKLFYLIIGFFLLGFAQLTHPWKLDLDKEDIKIYVRKSDSSSIKEYKAVMEVKSPMDTVLKKILDIKNLKNWSYKTNNSVLIKKLSDTSWVFYIQNNFDWPIKDRDHVSKVVLTRKKKECTIMLSDANNIVKVNPKIIRIKRFRGFWNLKKIDESTTLVTQQLFGDPEANVPAFVINSMLSKAPYETFKVMKYQLENRTKNSVGKNKN